MLLPIPTQLGSLGRHPNCRVDLEALIFLFPDVILTLGMHSCQDSPSVLQVSDMDMYYHLRDPIFVDVMMTLAHALLPGLSVPVPSIRYGHVLHFKCPSFSWHSRGPSHEYFS